MERRSFIGNALAASLYAALGSNRLCADPETKPNILWLTCEDANIGWIGCYGGVNADTPNIDKLAAEGFIYTNCFANAPVCAPSRCTWITGIHALSMGTHPMRSRYPIPHDRVKYYPDYLRQAGYFCSNHKKTDYNIGGRPDRDCWDSRIKYGWRSRKEGQPFFCVINHIESHESRAFGDVSNTRHDPAKVKLRQYHPDIMPIRQNYAHYQDAVTRMDADIGEALQQLADDGLAEDTIVFFCSDHGGVMPRSKRFLFESGIHAPFIARIPEKFRHLWPARERGSEIDRIVSFIDMPKTWLSLAGAEIPDVMQGRVFLGPNDEGPRDYHFSFRGRMDERLDNVRAVRDKRYLYIKNYMPYAPRGQHLGYLWRMAAMQAWERHYQQGITDEPGSRFFRPKADVEELYDTHNDPDCVVNLSANPEYGQVMERMRRTLRSWQLEIRDSGLLPESECVRRAEANEMTIYEMVRDPELYDLATYLDAADTALSAESANRKLLSQMLASEDLAVRYWAVVGMFMLDSPQRSLHGALESALEDESHEIRALAAWVLIKSGKKKAARESLREMLEKKSYASLTILNVIDWMDDEIEPYIPAIESVSDGDNEKKMRDYLLEEYG